MKTSSAQLARETRIFVAGHRGMVGSAIVRRLERLGLGRVITRSHGELDLTDQQAVRRFFAEERIDHIVLSAARVGGIHANRSYPAEFIYSNLMIQTNVIHEAWQAGIGHLLFLGSSCIYPKFATQPMREEYLLTGELEPTNEPYAVAKIAGIKMCESYNRQYGTQYRSVMPTNLYGPGDNYHLENSHVLPAMLRKFHLAKLAMEGNVAAIRRDEAVYGPIPASVCEAIGFTGEALTAGVRPKVVLWGTGGAYREFLYVDDMAEACVFVMGMEEEDFLQAAGGSGGASFLNIGTGRDQTIVETAELVREVVGFTGEILFDAGRPDGTPRKLLDCTRLVKLGWQAQHTLREGLDATYRDYCRKIENESGGRSVRITDARFAPTDKQAG